MLPWIVFALMAAGVVAALTRPLLRPPRDGAPAREADMAVYRDQLASLARERERGVVPASEAEGARAEIGRRLIEAGRESQSATPAAPPPALLLAVFGAAVLVPLLAIGAYLALGSPNLPGQPHAGRVGLPVEQASIEELVAKVEARLREKADDGVGWDALAPIYMAQQRHADAAAAFGKAITLLGETPGRLSGFAEASIRANNGIVGDAPRAAYQRLLAIEPGRLDARFWLTLGKEQDGDLPGAAADYRAIVAKASPGAPWRKGAELRLAEIEKKLGGAGPDAKPMN